MHNLHQKSILCPTNYHVERKRENGVRSNCFNLMSLNTENDWIWIIKQSTNPPSSLIVGVEGRCVGWNVKGLVYHNFVVIFPKYVNVLDLKRTFETSQVQTNQQEFRSHPFGEHPLLSVINSSLSSGCFPTFHETEIEQPWFNHHKKQKKKHNKTHLKEWNFTFSPFLPPCKLADCASASSWDNKNTSRTGIESWCERLKRMTQQWQTREN